MLNYCTVWGQMNGQQNGIDDAFVPDVGESGDHLTTYDFRGPKLGVAHVVVDIVVGVHDPCITEVYQLQAGRSHHILDHQVLWLQNSAKYHRNVQQSLIKTFKILSKNIIMEKKKLNTESPTPH